MGEKNRILNLDILCFILFLSFVSLSFVRSVKDCQSWSKVFALQWSVSPISCSLYYVHFSALTEHVSLHMECTCFGQIYLLDHVTTLLLCSLFLSNINIVTPCFLLVCCCFLYFFSSFYLTFFYQTKAEWLQTAWLNFYFWFALLVFFSFNKCLTDMLCYFFVKLVDSLTYASKDSVTFFFITMNN